MGKVYCFWATTMYTAGHHSVEVLSVEGFEKMYGAEELCEEDIKHKILVPITYLNPKS